MHMHNAHIDTHLHPNNTWKKKIKLSIVQREISCDLYYLSINACVYSRMCLLLHRFLAVRVRVHFGLSHCFSFSILFFSSIDESRKKKKQQSEQNRSTLCFIVSFFISSVFFVLSLSMCKFLSMN